METLFRKILTENNYELHGNTVQYYSNQDKSFFFWINLEEAHLRPLINKQLLKEDARYSTVLEGFKSLVNNGDQVAIEKNSSLIILVKCDNISSLASLQQQILLLEEDEYFFKKYVILYTSDSLSGLAASPILPVLKAKIGDLEKFDALAANGYSTELAEYILVLQLYIKLPFLKLDFDGVNFISLKQKLEAVLSNQLSIYNSLLTDASNITQIDFFNPDHGEKIDSLLNSLND